MRLHQLDKKRAQKRPLFFRGSSPIACILGYFHLDSQVLIIFCDHNICICDNNKGRNCVLIGSRKIALSDALMHNAMSA
jgi:hypothetical protein